MRGHLLTLLKRKLVRCVYEMQLHVLLGRCLDQRRQPLRGCACHQVLTQSLDTPPAWRMRDTANSARTHCRVHDDPAAVCLAWTSQYAIQHPPTWEKSSAHCEVPWSASSSMVGCSHGGRIRPSCAVRVRPLGVQRCAFTELGWCVPGGHGIDATHRCGVVPVTLCFCSPACMQLL